MYDAIKLSNPSSKAIAGWVGTLPVGTKLARHQVANKFKYSESVVRGTLRRLTENGTLQALGKKEFRIIATAKVQAKPVAAKTPKTGRTTKAELVQRVAKLESFIEKLKLALV